MYGLVMSRPLADEHLLIAAKFAIWTRTTSPHQTWMKEISQCSSRKIEKST